MTLRSYGQTEDNDVEENTLAYRNSMESSMNSTANMLKEVMKWPPINLKFNTSKRNTELTLKDLMKEIMFGLKLIDEALEIEN